MTDENGVTLKNGDIIDIHQTVNGENEFVVMNLTPLDIRYNYDRLREYEYDKEDLLAITLGEGFEIIGNIKNQDMADEAKKLIESVHVYKPNEIAFSSTIRDYVSKSDFDRVVEELTKRIEQKTSQKLHYEKMYNEANDELIKHGIRKSPIITDVSRKS